MRVLQEKVVLQDVVLDPSRDAGLLQGQPCLFQHKAEEALA